MLAVVTSTSDAGGKSSAELNAAFLKRQGKTSILHLLSAAKVQLLLDPSQTSVATDLVASPGILTTVPNTVVDCVTVHQWLLNSAKASDAAARFQSEAQAVYEYSTCFNGLKRLPLPEDGLVAQLKGLSVSATDSALVPAV